MARTLLDLVKNSPEVHGLLKQEPSSKLVRTYLKHRFGLSQLPVLITTEEWEEWLGSVQLETEKLDSTQEGNSTTRDYLSLVSNTSVDAYQDRRYIVRGVVNATASYSTTLRDLVEEAWGAVEERLSPIFECETLEELDELNLGDIEGEIYGDLMEFLEDLLNHRGIEYDSGDVEVRDEEIDITYDVQLDDDFRPEIEDFVNAVYERRAEELADN